MPASNSLMLLPLVVIVMGCNRSPSESASPAPAAPPSAERTGSSPAVASVSPVAATSAETPLAQTNANMINAMKPTIVGHVTLDGDLVNGVRQEDACRTTFTTSRGGTTIAWSQVANVVTHLVAGRQETALAAGKVSHMLSVPTGGYADADADGVRGALNQLAAACGPH